MAAKSKHVICQSSVGTVKFKHFICQASKAFNKEKKPLNIKHDISQVSNGSLISFLYLSVIKLAYI